MLIAHYSHRLPAGHDTTRERELATARGPVWDDVPDLYFKAFLLRERGRYGATDNRYSSLYLWKTAAAFAHFLIDGKYQLVVDLYGRADIPTWVGICARRGPGRHARFAYIDERDIPADASIAHECAVELKRNDSVAQQDSTVAAVVGIDSQRWRFRRILLSENEPTGLEAGTPHQVFYLARPLLQTLPHTGGLA